MQIVPRTAPVASATPTPAPAPAPSPAAAALPPLQDRTPEQLREGMVVNVRGAGSDDIAVARLIQDGAQYMARQADTTMGLATVEINYAPADRQGALGLATFQGTKGWFALSQRSTKGLLEGIERLRSTTWSEWSEAQRQAFVQANETILHEASHVTLNGYTPGDVTAWHRANRDFEEGLAEAATMTHIVDFMRDEFGVDIAGRTDRITQSTSAYTRFSERIERMLGMGTDGSPAALAAAASTVADHVRADERLPEIARRMGLALGGADAPQELVDEIAATLPGFVAEKNGTRTKLMEIQAALVDHAAGHSLDDPGDFVARLRADFDALAGTEPAPVNGYEPID
ncbi:MAG: hypothetical protein KDC46_11105 [Thermoleophilia bacterium]|nr:hypothetical protein [Thermoleophilia bacterium]